MTLPSSGPISLNNLATEYGVANTTPLGSYVGRPGGPTGNPVSLAAFYGLSNVLSVSISPSSINKAGTGSPNALLTTVGVTASSSNGTGPFTYAWTKVSDNGVGTGWQANTATAATTAFQATVPVSSTATAVFKVTVTDSTSAQGTANINVTLNNTGP